MRPLKVKETGTKVKNVRHEQTCWTPLCLTPRYLPFTHQYCEAWGHGVVMRLRSIEQVRLLCPYLPNPWTISAPSVAHPTWDFVSQEKFRILFLPTWRTIFDLDFLTSSAFEKPFPLYIGLSTHCCNNRLHQLSAQLLGSTQQYFWDIQHPCAVFFHHT